MLFSNPREEQCGAKQVVHRNFEEALNLVGVKVHRDDAVHTCRHEHVGHELGTDGPRGLSLRS